MDPDLPAFSIEEAWIVGTVFDMTIWAYGPHTREELLELAPDRVYGLDVNNRISVLDNHVHALNQVPKFFAVDAVPIRTRHGNISRAEWLWACLDLGLGRVTSLRDISLFVVAEVFELGLPPRQVTMHNVRERVPAEVYERVRGVADATRAMRGERDDRVHRGLRRPLGEDDLFWAAGMMEAMTPNRPPIIERAEGEPPLSLADEHRRLADEYTQEFIAVATPAMAAVVDLLHALGAPFEQRWREKRARSRLGDGYEVLPDGE